MAYSLTDDTQWTAPYCYRSRERTTLSLKISPLWSLSKDHIGVMWSNQTEHTMYFAKHTDGAPDNVWQVTPALQGIYSRTTTLISKHFKLATTAVVLRR
jgi:hypothetical protein